MKQILFIALLAIAQQTFSQGIVEGRVIDSTTKAPIAYAKLRLFTIKDTKSGDTTWQVIKTTYSDSSGYFKFDAVADNRCRISAFFPTRNVSGREAGEYEQSPLISFSGDCSTRVNFSLGVICKYDLTKDLTACPNCKKKDGVRKQAYGMPVISPGEKFVADDGEYYYNGYCTAARCHPTKICMYCRTEF